jgi:hypothetical protein
MSRADLCDEARAACRAALVLALLAVAAAPAAARPFTADRWRRQSIYQVMVDRFAAPAGTPACARPAAFCGGTFDAAQARLGHIADLNL